MHINYFVYYMCKCLLLILYLLGILKVLNTAIHLIYLFILVKLKCDYKFNFRRHNDNNNIIVLCAFIAYMIIMIVIGFVCSKGNKNNEDYFLGGETSAVGQLQCQQASDMSG